MSILLVFASWAIGEAATLSDRSLYNNLLGRELTDLSNQEQPRVWRLLIDRDGYFYIFPALPKKDRNLSVPVVIIYESGNGDQLTILAPPETSNKIKI